MKECVVVLGMHRSGTSVLTGLISFFGGYIGSDVMPPTEDNPKGYFENNKIYRLNERILKECGVSWDDYSFAVEPVDVTKYERYVEDAKIIIEDELKYVNKLIIKDPRLCVLFPIWEKALSELSIEIKVVFAYRSPVEVSHSLLKRDGIAIEKGLMIWSHYFFQSELSSRKYHRLMVEYNNDFKDLPKFIERLGVFLIQKPTDEILQKSVDFYSFKLRHHQVPLENISDDLPSYLISLKEFLLKKKLDDHKALDCTRNEFYRNVKYFRFDDGQTMLERTALKNAELRFIDLEKDAEVKFISLEQSHQELKEKLSQERQLLVLGQKKVENECKMANDALTKLRDIEQKYDELVLNAKKASNQAELSIKFINKSIMDKQHQIDLAKSYYASADKLFQRISNQPSEYKKLYEQSLNSSSLKLNKFLFLFGQNKRLARDKILIIDSGFFCPFFYLIVYSDVQHACIDPLEHFCTKGWREGRSPSMKFDSKAYLRRYPDVDKAKINPLIHYIQNGEEEGRIVDQLPNYI